MNSHTPQWRTMLRKWFLGPRLLLPAALYAIMLWDTTNVPEVNTKGSQLILFMNIGIAACFLCLTTIALLVDSVSSHYNKTILLMYFWNSLFLFAASPMRWLFLKGTFIDNETGEKFLIGINEGWIVPAFLALPISVPLSFLVEGFGMVLHSFPGLILCWIFGMLQWGAVGILLSNLIRKLKATNIET